MAIFNTLFEHQLIKKYSIAFGTLFNDMSIIRRDNNGTEIDRYKIPLTYSPKEKFIVRIKSDPNLTNKEGITLPRMAYDFVSMYYNAERKLTSKRLVGITDNSDANQKISFHNPVAYDITYNLYIATKTTSEMFQIVEQILPAFTPDYNIALNVFDNVSNFDIDIPISLVQNNLTDTYMGDIEERRTLIWTLTFVMKVYMFGPVKKMPIIKQVNFKLEPIGQENLPETDRIILTDMTCMPKVDGKLLNEIYETDDWTLETIFN